MKLLCILFTFVVVFLSVKPCCAGDDCDGVSKTEQSNNTKAKNCAGCSPFFSCGTCTGFTIAQAIKADLLLSPAKPGLSFTPYQQPNVKEISLSIWQPPQLG